VSRKVDFDGFYARHQRLYRALVTGVIREVDLDSCRSWITDFYGHPLHGYRVVLSPGPLPYELASWGIAPATGGPDGCRSCQGVRLRPIPEYLLRGADHPGSHRPGPGGCFWGAGTGLGGPEAAEQRLLPHALYHRPAAPLPGAAPVLLHRDSGSGSGDCRRVVVEAGSRYSPL